ncbi:MAG: hypothetical protein K0R26_915 [Bacteroidota bacterium]|jgi:uncharacterized protein (TIGR02284 family)|nr:hypothetical protein [Bacteroidota bacterium]
MEKVSQQFLEAINLLIEINQCRAEGYNAVADEISGSTMKTLFSRLAETSWECHEELHAELRRLGGIKEYISKPDMYLPWQDLKSMDINNNKKLVFTSSVYCDHVVKMAYEDALKKAEESMISNKDLISRHYYMITEDINRVSNLKKAFVS